MTKGIGVYRQGIRDHRAQSAKRVDDAQRGYESLHDKSTTYAHEIAALLALHIRVSEVWRTAPDEVNHD